MSFLLFPPPPPLLLPFSVEYLHNSFDKPFIRGGDFTARKARGDRAMQLQYSRAFGGKDLKPYVERVCPLCLFVLIFGCLDCSTFALGRLRAMSIMVNTTEKSVEGIHEWRC